jgi:hypothetical protein
LWGLIPVQDRGHKLKGEQVVARRDMDLARAVVFAEEALATDLMQFLIQESE